MVETLRATRKFSTVVLKSPYIQFLSGPPDDPTSIHKSGWVEGSSSYLSLNWLLLVSSKWKKKSSFQFKKNNNLRNKMIERTYNEVLSAVVNELLHPLLAVFTPHVRL
jgi:hypothetical protein